MSSPNTTQRGPETYPDAFARSLRRHLQRDHVTAPVRQRWPLVFIIAGLAAAAAAVSLLA